MNQVDKKYVILGSLCALVLMLVVGYAAFSTVLKIKGTSNITSNWDIKITNITEKNIVGSASTAVDESGNKKITGIGTLTATFETNLVSPNDSIEYDITITNNGTLDAKLDNITISDPDNKYITFETSGLNQNDTLEQKTNKTLTIKVTFKDVTINKIEPSTSSLTVTLDFSEVNNNDGNMEEPEPDPEPEFTGTGTVYRYTTDELNVGDSIEGIDITTDSKTLNKNYYLKHEVENSIIKKSYVCFVTDMEYCMNPRDSYNTNQSLLRNQQTWFNNNGGSCNLYSNPPTCRKNNYLTILVSTTIIQVQISNEAGCFAKTTTTYCK